MECLGLVSAERKAASPWSVWTSFCFPGIVWTACKVVLSGSISIEHLGVFNWPGSMCRSFERHPLWHESATIDMTMQ